MPVPTVTSLIHWTEPGQKWNKNPQADLLKPNIQYSTLKSWAHLALPAQSQVRCDRGSRSSGIGWRWAQTRCSGQGSRQGQSTYCKTQQRGGKRVRQREMGKATQKDQWTSTLGPGSTVVSDSLSPSLWILWNFPASISSHSPEISQLTNPLIKWHKRG